MSSPLVRAPCSPLKLPATSVCATAPPARPQAAAATFFAFSGAVLSTTFTIAFVVTTNCDPEPLYATVESVVRFSQRDCFDFFQVNGPALLAAFSMSLMASVFGAAQPPPPHTHTHDQR